MIKIFDAFHIQSCKKIEILQSFFSKKSKNMSFISQYFAVLCLPKPTTIKEDNWENEWYLVEVIDVYDGDTCTVRVRRNGEWWSQKIRMLGYDTPEMKPPKDKPLRNEEIALAKQARQAFCDQVLGKRIWMHSQGREKYGRVLGVFYQTNCLGGADRSQSVNTWMVEKGYGKKYDGGKKENFV